MKEEARVLVYGVGRFYGVFLTYRRGFLEELYIAKLQAYSLWRILEENLRTFNEVTYVVPCLGSKYESVLLPGFRVIEGGEELVVKKRYCRLVDLLMQLLDKRGLIMQTYIGQVVEVASIDTISG